MRVEADSLEEWFATAGPRGEDLRLMDELITAHTPDMERSFKDWGFSGAGVGCGTISYRTNAHRCDNSPYEGMKVFGSVSDVLLGGRHVVKSGKLIEEGKGRFVFRKASGRYRA